MKTIRNLMTLAGLALVVFALSATGANAQTFTTTSFSGTFTLPVAAQWGKMTLPAGEYSLSYGQPFKGGTYAVEVISKADGTSRGMVLVRASDDVSTKGDALVCVRQGDALIVRTLEMPEIHTAAKFALPHGVKLAARNRNHKSYTQLAEGPRLIEQIAITPKTN